MNKTYKIQYNVQLQEVAGGRIHRHRKATTSLPINVLTDMGLDEENNLINIHYDKNTKTITITKI
jgi:hypothetical protein